MNLDLSAQKNRIFIAFFVTVIVLTSAMLLTMPSHSRAVGILSVLIGNFVILILFAYFIGLIW